jgi:hypothetical protein
MAEMQEIEQEEVGELEAVEEEIQDQAVEPAPEPNDLPPQFRGKSPKEIAEYAAAIEKRLSKQGNELGEVRRLADELLKSQLMASKPVESEKPKEVDFFENPQEAVRQQVENHPAVRQAQEMALQARRVQAQQQFVAKHPDAGQIAQDPDFQSWVQASKVRMQLFQAADAYNVDAADELFSTYKELRSVKQQKTAEVDTKARDQAIKTAAVETGGSGESSKKVYRRSDLIRLKMRDPARYDAMADEIMSAYRDGRVR